ncbi:hypothetical protein HDV64DRAFT_283708 [Trichoderma sp. TUCIM 5745]
MVELSITREEALDTYGTLITDVLGDLIYVDPEPAEEPSTEEYEDLSEQLRQTLTKPIIMVLPKSEKTHLLTWARSRGHEEIIQWIRAAKEDKEEHTWTAYEYTTKAALEQKNNDLERSNIALERMNKSLKKQRDELAGLVKKFLKHHKGARKTFKRMNALAPTMKESLEKNGT